jgi:hypothetical protein
METHGGEERIEERKKERRKTIASSGSQQHRTIKKALLAYFRGQFLCAKLRTS